MTDVFETLFERLSSRGLMPVEIPRIIKDVFNIIRDGGDFTVASMNQALENLGWRRRAMDEISFELIIFLFENECDYEVERHNLH